MAPERLAAGRVHGQQIRLDAAGLLAAALHWDIALQHLHVELAIVEHWTCRERPQECEVALIFLDVARPKFVAGEVECDQIAVAIEENYALAIGRRRGRGEGAL